MFGFAFKKCRNFKKKRKIGLKKWQKMPQNRGHCHKLKW